MADDSLSLLFKLRGENAQLKGTLADSRAAISQLRSSSTVDLKALQTVSTASLGAVTQSLSQITTSIPGVGRAFSGITSQLGAVTQSSTAAGTSLAAMAGPIALAVAGVALLAGGVVTLTKNFFELTKATAEFQGKFFDLSQQVGVSVETLSTLDLIASTTGGNIDSVTASLGIFQKHLEASHDPTSKEAKLLGELGVTSTDTEIALRQTIKGLFEMTDKTKQTSTALELFGRGGRFVNAILKESHGDLDAATAKFQQMGLVVSTEAAAAADQFNDSLAILSRQFDAVTRQLTSATIPVFIAFFDQVSEAITGNKDSWENWAEFIAKMVAAVIAELQTLAQFIATSGQIDVVSALAGNYDTLVRGAQSIKTSIAVQAAAERAALLAATSGRPGDRPDAGKAASTAQARAAKEIAIAQKDLENATRFHRERLERERALDLVNTQEWVEASLEQSRKHLEEQQKIFEQERENIRRSIKNQADRQLALAEIDAKERQASTTSGLERQKIRDEGARREAASELALNRQLAAIRDAEREGELARIREERSRDAISGVEAADRQIALLKDQQAQRVLLIDFELKQFGVSADRKIELDNLKIESEQRYTDEFKRLTKERLDAMAEEQRKAIELRLPDDFDPNDVPIQDVGTPPEGAEDRINSLAEAFDSLGESMSDTFGISEENGKAFADILGGAFDALAQGIGNLVENWVLLGSTGPAAMRKLVASVLAGVAAQAAVKAIYELAEGFAALFWNPAAAAGHFTAAALFGSIAGVSAIAGRSIAGDLFKQPGSRDGRSGNNEGRSDALQTIIQGRNQVVRHEHVLRIVTNDSHIIETIGKNWRDGGGLRELVFNDGG